MIGKTVGGRYEIIEKIGEGGMATIYKAQDLRLKRFVALKVLSEKLAEDPDILSRFLREAQSAARLVHPNIVNVYDIEEFEGLNYIIMEYIDAYNLKRIIEKQAPFDRETALKVFRQIANAVKFAHENGIIHRDLKPQNVLVNSMGLLKVTDFGIARAVTSSSLTHTGTMMGTVQYFSPEQAQGKPVDRTTDIYSLGIILFEILTGKLPFEGDNLVAIALKQVQEEPPAPSDINPSVTPAMDRMVLKALSKNPGDRFQDMNEFIRDVEDIFTRTENEQESIEPMKMGSIPVIQSGEKLEAIEMEKYEEEDIYEDEEDDEEEEYEDESVGKKGHGTAVYILLLVSFLFLITIILYQRGDLSLIFHRDVVPDFVGISLSRARQKADANGWQLQIAEEVFHRKIPEDIIISQKPPVGEKLARGGTISVTISKGKTRIEVPDLVGLTVSQAQDELKSRGLKWVIRRRENSDSVPEDKILSQDPSAMEEVSPAGRVFLVVSLGQKKMEVPDLVGMTKDKATEAAAKNNLSIMIEERRHSSKYPEDHVISQNPAPGTNIEKGGKVKVVLSKGTEILIAPDLVGKKLGEAREILATLKIRMEVTDETDNDEAKVIGQEPSAGKKMDEKVIKVWAQEKVTVPNMLGKNLPEALKMLEDLGLSPKIERVESNLRPNIVLEQKPANATRLSRGSSVTLLISRKIDIPVIEPSATPSRQSSSTPTPTPDRISPTPSEVSPAPSPVVPDETGKGDVKYIR
ncbi:MAG: Stk1 family PASTA domain-containing Ser/Thr kinase [Candidatus Eremiobacteraeota bacterium]|nr:Stk1 family PASTA domain-containing Ser/Thr kinase [Candidatus Eremiobacteraeota bacterium]